MLPSILTALFFAASGICGRRTAVMFGALRANALRLMLAAVTLGLVVLWIGGVDFSTRAVHRLLVSGVVGFGLGDVGLFLAYPRLGSRLTLLINLCSAPLFGAVADGWLTGAQVSIAQGVAGLVILLGVSLALGSGLRLSNQSSRGFLSGVVAALVAGIGQGCGAALTRWAKVAANADGLTLMPLQEAFVRVLPGLAFGVVAWLISERWWKPAAGVNLKSGLPWLMGASLFGPVLGVGAFQWALGVAPSVVVLSITATTPVLIMPLAIWIENDRPSRLAVAGAIIAVAGVVLMGLNAA
ncbi:MAG: DMT family transporter [Verrucomicrobiaceae bacterium]